jgi:hypothetical protein
MARFNHREDLFSGDYRVQWRDESRVDHALVVPDPSESCIVGQLQHV